MIQDRNVFRFIDDLTTIVDGGEFEKVYHGNYLSKFEVKRQNSSDNKTSLLDLDLKSCKQKNIHKTL